LAGGFDLFCPGGFLSASPKRSQKDCIMDEITFIKPEFTYKSSRFDFYVETAGERQLSLQEI